MDTLKTQDDEKQSTNPVNEGLTKKAFKNAHDLLQRSMLKNPKVLAMFIVMGFFGSILISVVVTATHIYTHQSLEAEGKPQAPMIFENAPVALSDVKHFSIGIKGIEGWTFKSENGQHGMAYATTDGKHLISGVILDADNKNVTEAHMKEHLPDFDSQVQEQAEKNPVQNLPPKSNASSKLKTLQSMPYKIVQGTGPVDLYVAVDMTCPYCTTYFNTLQNMLDQYTIHWVPLALLSNNSLYLAAGILESDDPLEAMQAVFAGDKSKASQNPEQQQKIIAMTNVAREAGITGVPLTVFKVGDSVKELPGARSAAEIKRITSQ